MTLTAVAVASAGCSDGDGGSAPPTDQAPSVQAPSPAPVDPVAEAEQAALAAYRGMWDAYTEAIQIPDPQHPGLAEVAADDALEVLVNGLEQVERDGLAGRGEVVLDPQVTELTPADAPTSAKIRDCVDTSGTELYRTDGEPHEDTPGGLRRTEATVRDEGTGTWKVVGFALYEVGSCAR